MTDVKTFYAEIFCKGNLRKAGQELNELHNTIRRKDMALITCFSGMDFVLVIVMIFFCVIDPIDGHNHWGEIFSNVETFILTAVIVFIMVAAAFCVQMFRKYGVNYQFIFELDHNYKMIHHQLYTLAIILFTIWLACLTF